MKKKEWVRSRSTYTYNGNGQRVQKTEGSDVTNYFYTEDQRGSSVNLLDSTGSQVVSYWYNDFGEVIESKVAGYSSFVNEIQYTGGIYDELTGLLYLNARFYDPSTGRFITQNTYRGERNNADTWHLYAYCANNPINFVDPSGHFRMPKTVLATALDVVFTVAVPYIAGPLDLWGHTFKAVAKTVAKKNTKRIGQKNVVTLWDDFLRGPVPKIKGYMGSAATKIREVVWGSTRVVAPNVTNTVMGTLLSESINGVSKILEEDSTGKVINFMLNFTSLGGSFACLLQLGDSKRPKKSGIAGIIEDGTGNYVYFP